MGPVRYWSSSLLFLPAPSHISLVSTVERVSACPHDNLSLRLGHTHAPAHLHRCAGTLSPRCPCGEPRGTDGHILLECPLYDRSALRGVAFSDLLASPPPSSSMLFRAFWLTMPVCFCNFTPLPHHRCSPYTKHSVLPRRPWPLAGSLTPNLSLSLYVLRLI